MFHLLKTKKELENLCKQEKQIILTRMKYFQHYGQWKDLAERTQSDKVFRIKTFKLASDPKFDRYQKGLSSMVYNFFDKKSTSGSDIKSMLNQQNASELHKPIIKILKRRIYSLFKDNIWGVDVADI